MIAIRGVYERHQVVSLNHGVGFDTAAIELLLPTYGESLGPQGRDRAALGAQPASHPDPGHRIGLGRVDPQLRRRIGHERYAAARPDVFFTGARRLAALQPGAGPAGRASTPSTCSSGRRCRSTATPTPPRSPTGGCPVSAGPPTWATTRTGAGTPPPPGWTSRTATAPAGAGRKLVVQIAQTFRAGGVPTFVETLDADRGRQGRPACRCRR